MSNLYQNKYRIPSARLQNWDYGSNAMYFVTICTAHRECYFGEIVETPNLGVSNTTTTPTTNKPQMALSDIGKIAQQYWIEIPNHFPFVTLGEWVVMPNHVHGIIIIDKPLGDVIDDANVETPKLGVSTGTLGVIINQYKRIVTINARKIHADFAWQSRFHDHIIRNNESFQRISNYIANNPSKWEDDKFHRNS